MRTAFLVVRVSANGRSGQDRRAEFVKGKFGRLEDVCRRCGGCCGGENAREGVGDGVRHQCVLCEYVSKQVQRDRIPTHVADRSFVAQTES